MVTMETILAPTWTWSRLGVREWEGGGGVAWWGGVAPLCRCGEREKGGWVWLWRRGKGSGTGSDTDTLDLEKRSDISCDV